MGSTIQAIWAINVRIQHKNSICNDFTYADDLFAVKKHFACIFMIKCFL